MHNALSRAHACSMQWGRECIQAGGMHQRWLVHYSNPTGRMLTSAARHCLPLGHRERSHLPLTP